MCAKVAFCGGPKVPGGGTFIDKKVNLRCLLIFPR